ncbi:MAG TPA: glycosyltransferase family 9 protein [Puia sp.]|nr:glycosyltransferase family 9 protein [Puia sp.]
MPGTSFIISRTDAIGDVVLTLPVAGVLRSLYPQSRIYFLGRAYTREVIQACVHVDEFLDWDEWKDLPEQEAAEAIEATGADTIIHVFPDKRIARLAKRAGISQRIGTTNRIYHWLTCNLLVKLSRRHSPYHEAQLNLKLLVPLGASDLYTLDEIGGYYGLTRLAPLPAEMAALIDPHRFNLVMHPKSRGSAREWGLDNFSELIGLLPGDRYKIFITGTKAEGELLGPLLAEHPDLIDLTGRLSLGELMAFLAGTDALIAASTGPLHLAAALGIHALGIYPPIRPMHPGRWAPIGSGATVFVKKEACEACRKTADCSCMRGIGARLLKDYLDQLPAKK